MKNRRSATIVACFLAFLVMATANHCILEDLFATLSQNVFKSEASHHLPNHLGSNTKHTHDNEPEPHEHGDKHPVYFLTPTSKSASEILNFLDIFAPIVFVGTFFAREFWHQGIFVSRNLLFDVDPHPRLSTYLSILTAAPQAPPIAA